MALNDPPRRQRPSPPDARAADQQASQTRAAATQALLAFDQDTARQLRQDMAEAMQHAPSARVFFALVQACHVHDSTFTGNSEGFKLEGMRTVGLQLRSRMRETALEVWHELDVQAEQHARERRRLAELAMPSAPADLMGAPLSD